MRRSFSYFTIIIVVISLLAIWSLIDLKLFDGPQLLSAVRNLSRFFSEIFPPRWDIVPVLFRAMWETIQISFTGTILGFLMSLPLAFCGANNLFGKVTTGIVRMIVGAIRTIPSILWGVIFVIALGLGPAAGTLGVACYTIGYLAKMFYEAFEAVDFEVIEAVRSTGCNRIQLFRFAILPESANTIISQLLFMFEYNIRASTIMGFVGAGGIGYYMMGYIQMLQYQYLLMTLIVTFVVVMAIDYLSLRVRSTIAAGEKN